MIRSNQREELTNSLSKIAKNCKKYAILDDPKFLNTPQDQKA